MSTPADTGSARAGRDRAQYGVCAGLAGLGIVILADAARIGHAASSNDPLGPRTVPVVVGIGLLVVAAFYALDVARGGRGESEHGEDIDLDTRADLRTIGLLAGVLLVSAVLMEPLGWVISGSLLFTGAALALGSRRPVLALAVGVALGLVTFYAFAIGLGVNLPAGVLQGIL